MIYTALDNFYLTDEELGNSPSRKHDIDEETETTLRIFGCELIQEAGILLKCPQAVMATGQVLFQRFFCRKSMREYNVRRMACACLFLATKLEESHRRTRDILMVFDRINKRREGSKNVPLLIPETKEYDVMKERVITYERILLKTFGFIIHAVHPHKYVNSFVHSLDGSDELQQLAWNMLNDSLRTTLCVRFKAHVVAAGAIYLAARRLQAPLPLSPPWWEAFKVPTDQLVEVVQSLHNLYQRPKAHYIEVNPDVLKQQQAASGMCAKQLTPGLEGNESPAGQDSSVIRGGPDLASQQQGPPVAGAPVVTSTAGPAGANAAADMLAAAVAAAQQRLQGTVLVAGATATGVTVTAGAAAQQQSRQDLDLVSTVQQGPNGPTITGGAGQANGGVAASALDGRAAQSRKRSRSRSQDKSRKRSRSSSRSPSPSRSRSLDRDRDRERTRRSRSRERDRHRDFRKDGSRRDRRSRSRSRDRDHNRDRRDRDREREKERERGERDRRERDGKADRGRERERERGSEKPTDREARSTGANREDTRDRRDDGSLPPPPLPPRHPDRLRR
ncbi:hypothetical protein Vafri_2145 [Volvox africanus]|nr:hypothetical protein Vafri_2145 [Volvox africanus]